MLWLRLIQAFVLGIGGVVDYWLDEAGHIVWLAIEAMAIVIMACASVEAFLAVLRLLFGKSSDDQKRAVYLRYLRWLIAALTFQLAADIVHTTIAPSWPEIGQLAAIAAIRTFLGYFLERDLIEAKHIEKSASSN